jgi:gamma-glutamyltranspeptidase / glutathione hydrolase / leukotriene-C4 hydrolase
LGQDVKEAIDAPRLHHQLLPMRLEYESNFVRKHLQGLQDKGHHVAFSSTFAVVQGLTRDEDMTIEANCDFRKKGAPAGL